jgi:hypothetical protein
LETLGAAVDWAQGLTAIPKGIITSVLLLLWVLAVAILWQKPHSKTESLPETSTIQAGNTASTGQSGGVTAGLYINQAPPVTDQQKEEAKISLESELDELVNFPNRPDSQPARTYFEMMATEQMPRRLYAILTKYYRPTIESVSSIGADLVAYKSKYYDFQDEEYNFENDLTTQIGALAKPQFRDAWGLCLRYFVMRTHGLTREQIISGGNFLNYGITWDDAESITSELLKKSDVSRKVGATTASQNAVWEEAKRIMNKYK